MASVIEKASFYDSIERAAGFGLENALLGTDRLTIRRDRCGPLFPLPDGAYSEWNYPEPPKVVEELGMSIQSPRHSMFHPIRATRLIFDAG